MPGNRRTSPMVMFRPVVRVLTCAAGLFGGLVAGGLVVYVSGLWHRLDSVLGMPIQAITTSDLITASASFAVVFGCAWFGMWVGLRLAARI